MSERSVLSSETESDSGIESGETAGVLVLSSRLNINYSESHHHTVVPLALARKRMSEILSYKVKECSVKVTSPVC